MVGDLRKIVKNVVTGMLMCCWDFIFIRKNNCMVTGRYKISLLMLKNISLKEKFCIYMQPCSILCKENEESHKRISRFVQRNGSVQCKIILFHLFTT